LKDRTYFSYRKTGYIIRNCYSKDRDVSVTQTVCKEKLNIISQDYDSESIYEEDNYDGDND